MSTSGSTASSSPPIVCPGHSRPIVDVRFVTTSEDQLNLLVSSCHDKTSQLRWADNGAWIGTFQGHNGAVWSTSLDQTGQRAVTASADFSVKLWNVTTGAELATYPHQHVVKAVDFSSDSKSFLSAGLEKKSFIFDVETSKTLAMYEHPCQIPKAIWISENTFMTGGMDGILRNFDRREESTKAPSSIVTLVNDVNPKRGVTDIEYVKGSNTLVTCSGRNVNVFNLSNPDKPLFTLKTKFEAEAASISPNGKKLVAGGSDLWLHVFDTNSFQELSVNRGHHGPIFCTRWNSSGNSVASGSEDGTIRIWPISQE